MQWLLHGCGFISISKILLSKLLNRPEYISLCLSGKDNHKLHVRELPDLTVDPWQIELESDEELKYYAEPEGLTPGLQPELQPEVLLQPSLQPELQLGICN